MMISNHMKRNVVSIHAEATIREAAAILVEKHIGLLPVVNDDNELVGVVGLKDMLSLEMPDFVNFIADLDFVHDFGAVEATRPSAAVLDRPVTTLIKPVIPVEENAGLLRAYALMLQQDLHDIPVVSKERKLVGIASRVDIGTAILSAWKNVE